MSNHTALPIDFLSAFTVVLGMGITGLASARFLAQRGQRVYVMDNREQPPYLAQCQALQAVFPQQLFYKTGNFDSEILCQAEQIVISPGLALTHAEFAAAQQLGIPFISEIELFARHANAPVVAITGSNGKSTVTTLVGEMATQAGWQVRVGGNLGTPALDLLTHPAPDLYVLELSSFQLETTYSLETVAAVVLNISEDHMDRYDSLHAYAQAKARIYQHSRINVINADDPQVVALLDPQHQHSGFSLHCNRATFSVCHHHNKAWLIRHSNDTLTYLLPADELLLSGSIMQANALAALALGEAAGIPLEAMLTALRQFQGLPHRCRFVRRYQGIDFYNDSKGTNVGASIAAMQTLARPGQVILIAGGDGKGADFNPLAEVAATHLRACVTLGRDGDQIGDLLREIMPVVAVHTMAEAVLQAYRFAQAGDAVLLSPACSSLDMFNDYTHRGDVFTQLVLNLAD
jgi:UDP-N-acetylmuramoylalanine--D-glutamate ligase